MQYDFDTILDRRGRDALALDMIPYDGVEPKEGFSRIPMWVADMSFPTAPPVLEAIRARLDHPNFGYFQLSDAYFDSIIRWQQVRHGVTGLERQHIGYENGVLGGVSSVVQALTCPGEPILVHSPTYVGFTHTLERLGRPIIHTPLTQDAEGIWRMDYAGMDRKLRENDIHVAILCSTHNPCGRVALGLHVPLEQLIACHDDPPTALYRAVDVAGQRLCGGKVIAYRLFPFDPESRSESLQLDLFISGRYEGPDRVPGSWVYVTSLSGTAEVTTGGETYRLENRDCLSFPGSQPYCYENVGNNTVRLIQRIVYKK